MKFIRRNIMRARRARASPSRSWPASPSCCRCGVHALICSDKNGNVQILVDLRVFFRVALLAKRLLCSWSLNHVMRSGTHTQTSLARIRTRAKAKLEHDNTHSQRTRNTKEHKNEKCLPLEYDQKASEVSFVPKMRVCVCVRAKRNPISYFPTRNLCEHENV